MSGIARRAAEAAKRASEVLGVASEEVRNEALFAMAAALRAERAFILEANERDMNAAREAGTERGASRPPHAQRSARGGDGGFA